jgi:hypothetical protein
VQIFFKSASPVKDKGKGKSGGFRVITYLIIENQDETEIFLITIYDKTKHDTIKKAELIKLINRILGSN